MSPDDITHTPTHLISLSQEVGSQHTSQSVKLIPECGFGPFWNFPCLFSAPSHTLVVISLGTRLCHSYYFFPLHVLPQSFFCSFDLHTISYPFCEPLKTLYSNLDNININCSSHIPMFVARIVSSFKTILFLYSFFVCVWVVHIYMCLHVYLYRCSHTYVEGSRINVECLPSLLLTYVWRQGLSLELRANKFH